MNEHELDQRAHVKLNANEIRIEAQKAVSEKAKTIFLRSESLKVCRKKQKKNFCAIITLHTFIPFLNPKNVSPQCAVEELGFHLEQPRL